MAQRRTPAAPCGCKDGATVAAAPLGGIGLGAEVVSPGDTGKSPEMLRGGNREGKSSPVFIEGAKAPSAGQAGLPETRQRQDGQGGLTSPSPVPCAPVGF